MRFSFLKRPYWAAFAAVYAASGLILGCAGRARAYAPTFAQPGSIHWYVERDNLARVKQMLRQNPALLEQHQSFLGTPLAVAAAEGKSDIFYYLLSRHAYVNARSSDKYDSQTVLMAACSGYDVPDNTRMAIVRAVIAAGALVRVVDRSGYTALDTAAVYGHADIVNLLMNDGADIMATDQEGRTAFTEAMRGAALWDDWRLMRFIRVAIAQGADVNARSASGETMLDLAAQAGAVHTMEYLLLQGADLNARDRSGRTALTIAQQRDQPGAVDLLRQHGALPDPSPIAAAPDAAPATAPPSTQSAMPATAPVVTPETAPAAAVSTTAATSTVAATPVTPVSPVTPPPITPQDTPQTVHAAP